MPGTSRFEIGSVLVLVATGGFFGANARYVLDIVFPALTSTLVANVVGCFLLGFIVYETLYTGPFNDQARLLVSTGFVSSFTTYSTFAFQTVSIEPLIAVLYVAISYGFGFFGVLVGRHVARRTGGSIDD